MRTRVGADRQPVGHQQPGDDLCRGTLAVGSRDVQGAVRAMWVAQQLNEAFDVVEARRFDATGLFVDRVTVEKLARSFDWCQRHGTTVVAAMIRMRRAWALPPVVSG